MPEKTGCIIRIVRNGPYLVKGNVPLEEKIIVPAGKGYRYETGRTFSLGASYILCRCGRTKTPPFCDGSHTRMRFDGKETASRAPYEDRAERYRGPGLDLTDDGRCAYARFCHREQGNAWELTMESADPTMREEAMKAAWDCPTGRLEVRDKAGKVMEPVFPPSIEVLQDPEEGVSGPLFVKGLIPLVSSDGTVYEIRNRYALCRCGRSRIKPFCDAAHVMYHFQDHL